jgi:hypothetical protein
MTLQAHVFASCPDWVTEQGLEDEDWVQERWND